MNEQRISFHDHILGSCNLLTSMRNTMSDCKKICLESQELPTSLAIEFKTAEKSLTNIVDYIKEYNELSRKEEGFIKVKINKPKLRLVGKRM